VRKLNDSLAVELINVSKVYTSHGARTEALRSLSLRVRKGEAICIMGPSGAGKTTLLKVASGYLEPDEGIVRLMGINPYSLSTEALLKLRRENVGFMFQEDLLIDTLTVFENVELPLIIEGIPRHIRTTLVLDAINSVWLQGKEERKPDEVSGGERRRISLARSIVKKPKILFADEPTSNLDVNTARNIMQLLREINEQGVTLIVATHDPLVAGQFERRMEIRDGKLTEASNR
jgi:ABC-type lipoprotein export system ATPase subunit